MAGKIIATFNNKKDADRATRALKDADIEPGTDMPENGGNTVVIAPVPGAATTGTLGNTVPAILPAQVDDDANVDEERVSDGQTIISISVRDDAEADRVMAIVREHGGTADQGTGSTIDEVANPAQSRDRI